ncbi:hypothetical protein GC093_29900 [Paenibacillus sp. LMG 31456]|uniref:Uncharacterized protein n=1 Tax=Paenibacillus foliorum TaxID=2654974 RepID=A0A972H0X2_9BACL|nr:hypothetical protein [Paenibacillus foliorum]NOU97412.1 hypothetical protein [Paenibacillus foliorum]
MNKTINWHSLLVSIAIVLIFVITGFSGVSKAQESTEDANQNQSVQLKNIKDIFPGKITLSTAKGVVGTQVHFTITGLEPDTQTDLDWKTVEGKYDLKGLYEFIGASFKDKVIPLRTGKSDANGELEGDFTIPSGFGGNHTIYVKQANKLMTQANIHVNPTFNMSPSSGPIGTEITITADGIGYDDLERNWQLTYDNKLTGLLTAITTDGKAVAKIRAAGPVGKHTLTIWHGYLGIPYINHEQAPTSYLPVPSFSFDVTNEKADMNQRVEPIPSAADGGVVMPELKNELGVSVSLDKDAGVVGDTVTMKASGLPKNQKINLIWNTMRGSRITQAGFGEEKSTLLTVKTDDQGSFIESFPVPDDLGGIPHRIDLEANGKIYGQTYLSIIPSIVKVSPSSGPAGTPIQIEIKGVGWTEYDNTYNITYDNGYVGYVCGFNSAGTVIVNLIASGEPGYHIIDFYPGIYRGRQQKPDIYLAPQLTYENDHPGSAIPAIRLGFEVVNP